MQMNILIVDDDKRLLSTLSSLLIEENHRVVPCDNGLDGIRKCREDKFDLVITDLMMPGASGLDVLRETRKVSPSTLVVLVTGFASLESAVEAIREGAYDYVAKPFKLEEIKILIQNASERIRLARENQRLLAELQEAYGRLQTVKEIMGIGKGSPIDAATGEEPSQTFIAGSMLPLYYQDNHGARSPALVTDLERLCALKEKGLLSEEEFNQCKSRMLGNFQS
ncbi:MAG: response regulator [Thermodesulfobacteriota bacterium]